MKTRTRTASLSATCGLLLLWSQSPIEAEPLVQPNDTLAICGDSITAMHLYSAYMEDYLLMCQPTEGLKVVQFGWSGEKAPGFLARLETDVFPFKPTIATTCYGMNDGASSALTDDIANAYRKAQTDIVLAMKKNGVRTIVLGSSKCVDPSFFHRTGGATAEVYNQTLASLGKIDKEIAAKEGVVYADVFQATMDAMKKSKEHYGENYNFGGADGVHPNANGQLVMAYAFLRALGYDGDIATLTVDMEQNKATATAGQEVVDYKNGFLSLKSSRYPFCFNGDKTEETNGALTSGILGSVPFNQELNRYLLVVKGLKSAKAKITWGTQSKEFTSAELEKGVNLAAEFLNNPFRDQFLKVHQAVQMQQQLETQLVQNYMHNVPSYKASTPSASDAVDQWTTSGMALREALFQGAKAFVIPITHTIRIEPLVKANPIFGDSRIMEDESLLFHKGDGSEPPSSRLLFPATSVRRITNLVGDTVYEEGKDYTLSADKTTIQLPPTSRIPYFTSADLYLKAQDPMGISHKAGEPDTWLLWGPKTDPFLQKQCAITYEHEPSLWKGYLPTFAGAVLPKTMAKLKNKEPLTISVSGDSISFGYQSTLSRKLAPNRPGFFPQVAEGLQAYYGSPITLKNHAIPGWSATGGLKDLPNLLKDKPDLVFIAYGMNDIGGNNAPAYGTNVKAIIDQIHQEFPQTEIILLSTSIGNPEWALTPPERFPIYRDQLKALEGPGCAFVDITAVWEELLKHKTYWDITGNGVNHPNDFGHRIYAEMILLLLTPAS